MNRVNDILERLRAEETVIQEELERMRKPVAQREAALQHIQGLITYYQENCDKRVLPELVEAMTEALATIPLSRLKNLSHSDAVIAIAKYNGGIVRTQEVKRLMIKAGIMSKTKNSTNMAHNAIQRMGRFERVSPGEYRLKELKTDASEKTLFQPNQVQ